MRMQQVLRVSVWVLAAATLALVAWGLVRTPAPHDRLWPALTLGLGTLVITFLPDRKVAVSVLRVIGVAGLFTSALLWTLS